MKIALVTDTHFGGKSDSEVFAKYNGKFYNDIFFPYLKQHNIKTCCPTLQLWRTNKNQTSWTKIPQDKVLDLVNLGLFSVATRCFNLGIKCVSRIFSQCRSLRNVASTITATAMPPPTFWSLPPRIILFPNMLVFLVWSVLEVQRLLLLLSADKRMFYVSDLWSKIKICQAYFFFLFTMIFAIRMSFLGF